MTDDLPNLSELDKEVYRSVVDHFGASKPPGFISLNYRYKNFSSKIADAWLLVELLKGYQCSISTPFAPGEKFFVGFTPHYVTGWNGKPDHEVAGSSVEEAICMAFLLTIKAEKEKARKE